MQQQFRVCLRVCAHSRAARSITRCPQRSRRYYIATERCSIAIGFSSRRLFSSFSLLGLIKHRGKAAWRRGARDTSGEKCHFSFLALPCTRARKRKYGRKVKSRFRSSRRSLARALIFREKYVCLPSRRERGGNIYLNIDRGEPPAARLLKARLLESGRLPVSAPMYIAYTQKPYISGVALCARCLFISNFFPPLFCSAVVRVFREVRGKCISITYADKKYGQVVSYCYGFIFVRAAYIAYKEEKDLFSISRSTRKSM